MLLGNHHGKGGNSAYGVDSVNDSADLHPGALYPPSGVGSYGENPGKYHKGGVSRYYDFCCRGFKSPGEASQGKNGPGDKEHKGTDCFDYFTFHIFNSFL